jgi:serine/threonine-protein phosphatase 6 regulatory ankyrin repeat subunit B
MKRIYSELVKPILFLIVSVSFATACFAASDVSEKNAKLFKAAREGSVEAVQAALANGAEINAKHPSGETAGETALMIATHEGHAKVVKLLLDKDADVNATRTTDGVTALWIASHKGHPEIVKLLLAAKADVNAKKTTDGETPLWIASHEGHAEVVKLLLAAKADFTIKAKDGKTALWIAKHEGHKEVVKLLEKAGAKE